MDNGNPQSTQTSSATTIHGCELHESRVEKWVLVPPPPSTKSVKWCEWIILLCFYSPKLSSPPPISSDLHHCVSAIYGREVISWPQASRLTYNPFKSAFHTLWWTRGYAGVMHLLWRKTEMGTDLLLISAVSDYFFGHSCPPPPSKKCVW